MLFNLFQQLKPKKLSEDNYECRLDFVGTIEATSGAEAIKLAKNKRVFREGKELGRYPIVENLTLKEQREREDYLSFEVGPSILH